MNDGKDLEIRPRMAEIANRIDMVEEGNWANNPRLQLPAGDLDLVCIQCGEQYFAFYLYSVIEAIRMVKLTPLPGVSSTLVGLLNLRKQIVPILDLRLLLGMSVRAYDENTPIVLLEYGEGKRGVIVDTIINVMKVPAATVEAPQGVMPHCEYIAALVRSELGLIMVLDHTKLLRFENEQYLEMMVKLR